MPLDPREFSELLYQALETELGGVQLYRAAIEVATNDGLREEWTKYLEQTTRHVELVTGVLEALGLDPNDETPGREVVRHLGKALVKAIELARASGNEDAAQTVAAECVTLAETKDHLNWELLGMASRSLTGQGARALREAHEEVEGEEDEHLYHTTGWTRELWLAALGLPAVLPPPEERRKVTTAIGAARAKQARGEMSPKAKRVAARR